MLHREAFRRKRAENQSQPADDNKSSDEVTVNERCAIPRDIYNDIAVIASASKKTNCEVQIEAIKYYVDRAKLRQACRANQLPEADCKCSEV